MIRFQKIGFYNKGLLRPQSVLKDERCLWKSHANPALGSSHKYKQILLIQPNPRQGPHVPLTCPPVTPKRRPKAFLEGSKEHSIKTRGLGANSSVVNLSKSRDFCSFLSPSLLGKLTRRKLGPGCRMEWDAQSLSVSLSYSSNMYVKAWEKLPSPVQR